jgi:predicted transcriptional regulator
LIRYIHQNPIRSKLTESLKYLWSSHREYIGIPELADVNFPLSLFDTHKKKAIKRYLAFMDEMETKEVKSMNKEETIEVAKNIERLKIEKEALIKIIEEVTKIEMEKIKGNSKSKRVSDIRKLYIKKLKKYTDITNKEIANLLGIGNSTVTNVLSGRYKDNDFLIKSSIEIDKNVNL